jgi:hypothetical protein
MGTFTIRKTKAARTRIRGCKGHYMGLKLGLFFKMPGNMGSDLWQGRKKGSMFGKMMFLPRNYQSRDPDFFKISRCRIMLFLKFSDRDTVVFRKVHQPCRTFSRIFTSLPVLFKKDRLSSRTFLGIFTNSTGLFFKSSTAEPDMFRNLQRAISTFFLKCSKTVGNFFREARHQGRALFKKFSCRPGTCPDVSRSHPHFFVAVPITSSP